jgi:hypothetical protein
LLVTTGVKAREGERARERLGECLGAYDLVIEGGERCAHARESGRDVEGALLGGEPEVDPRAKQSGAQRVMVASEGRRNRGDAVASQRAQQAARASKSAGEADAQTTQLVPAEEGVTEAGAKREAAHVGRAFADANDAVGHGEERGDRCAQVTPRGHGLRVAPGLVRVDREERQGGTQGCDLEHTIEHEDVCGGRRELDRARAGGRDHDPHPMRLERARRYEALVPHLGQRVIRGYEARAPRPRAVGVAHEDHRSALTRELPRARDRERRLARAPQRRAAHRDDAYARRDRQWTHQRARRNHGPGRSERARDGALVPTFFETTGKPQHLGTSGRLLALMLAIDPLRLARRQLEIDREKTSRYPHLLKHKGERMSASPLALLRGAAPLFYELLEAHPTLAEGPRGEGWLVGDCHLENFGAFRTGALSVKETRASHAADRVVFDLNDFDDTFVGPWRFDVVRLATSLILGGREIGLDGTRTLSLCDALLEAYVGAVFHRKKTPPAPQCVMSLIEKVQKRTRKELLDARTRFVGEQRRFVRGLRYESLPKKLRAKAERAFAKYVKRLPDAERPPAEAVEARARGARRDRSSRVRLASAEDDRDEQASGVVDVRAPARPAGGQARLDDAPRG